jgi:glucose-1-phosphate thymidylyltransferase
MKKYYGLLPAAGMGMRMRPFRYPKELLPVHFEVVQETDFIRPKLLIEYSLEALSLGGVTDVYIVVPEWKPEIMRYLEDGDQFGHHISYLYNSKALGLADALLSAYPWLKDKNTCFAMPDTVFSPPDAFESVNRMLEEKDADLVLGVFPTDEAKHFAPVEFDSDGRVISIWEKPEHPKVNHVWGIAAWTPVFWEYFKQRSENLEPGISITETFDKAGKDGLKVFCVYFSEGWYKDVGRINQISMVKQ